MIDKVEFVIPIDKDIIKNGTDALLSSLIKKRSEISNGISASMPHQAIRKQLISTKITLNSLIVKVSKFNHLDDTLELEMEELEFIMDILKEDVFSYFIQSLVDDVTESDKNYAYRIMNVFKYINNTLEVKSNGTLKKEC